MIQIDGTRCHVFIKFTKTMRMLDVLAEMKGRLEFKHDNGEISQVTTELAGRGMRKIRIANLLPEVNASQIRACLVKYGEVKEIRDEMWNRVYQDKVSNGVRIADMNLKQHVPSHMTIDGHRALISYNGQPTTCYGCNNTGHYYQDCPSRKRIMLSDRVTQPSTWADIVANVDRTPNVSAACKDTETPHEARLEMNPTQMGLPPLRHMPSQQDVYNNQQVISQTGSTASGYTQEKDEDICNEETPMDVNGPTAKDEQVTEEIEVTEHKGRTQPKAMQWTAGDSEEEQDISVYEPDNRSAGDGMQYPTPNPQTDDEPQTRTRQDSPKRMNKLRTEKDLTSILERTRSTVEGIPHIAAPNRLLDDERLNSYDD
jgi:hypothetical protein